MTAPIYDFEAESISGKTVKLSEYEGKPMLIVNTASKCGLTPQYEGLEKLYEEYKDQGLVVLGFPCNQFAGQEPGSESDIEEFCQLNYGVTFPMFSKIDVNGRKTHPIFQYLKKAKKGFMGSENIKWNFTKFLINRDGDVVERFAPTDIPRSIARKIKPLL
ncbi:MAG: glutathione peroxidase [Oceanicoccus sp.]|jgi:glutathione peroxidase